MPASKCALASALVIAATVAAGSSTSAHAAPPFRGAVERIPASVARSMTGVSWRPGCPVALRDLRLVTVTHRRFDGGAATGRLVVHEDVADAVVRVFRSLYAAGFPIRRMQPIDRYGGSDFRSIEADNTSAFNCRRVEGSSSWSEHAYGRAIDLNPIENPYVAGGRTSHPASVPFLDRTPCRRGMACPGSPAVRAFAVVGWEWGGDWRSVQDYQHFSASGR